MSPTKQLAENNHHHIFRLRRRPFTSWILWFLWFLTLLILLEFTVTSFDEREPQAGIIAGALFFGILLAGFIVEIIKTVESRSQYRDLTSNYETVCTSEDNHE